MPSASASAAPTPIPAFLSVCCVCLSFFILNFLQSCFRDHAMQDVVSGALEQGRLTLGNLHSRARGCCREKPASEGREREEGKREHNSKCWEYDRKVRILADSLSLSPLVEKKKSKIVPCCLLPLFPSMHWLLSGPQHPDAALPTLPLGDFRLSQALHSCWILSSVRLTEERG